MPLVGWHYCLLCQRIGKIPKVAGSSRRWRKYSTSPNIIVDQDSEHAAIIGSDHPLTDTGSPNSQHCRQIGDAKGAQDQQRRVNPLGVQMIPESLRRHLFPGTDGRPNVSEQIIQDLQDNIKRKLNVEDVFKGSASSGSSPNYDSLVENFVKLRGSNLDEHFSSIAQAQVEPYCRIVDAALPFTPPQEFLSTEWVMAPGWTRYVPGCRPEAVPFPDEEFLVFDVEVAVKEGQGPVLAIAAAPHAWYSWCSRQLIETSMDSSAAAQQNTEEKIDMQIKQPNPKQKQQLSLDDLIPMETGVGQRWEDVAERPRLVVGHNVAYDRLRIRDQYFLQGSKLRFLDTMSMHIGMNGLAADQRILYKTELKNQELKIDSPDEEVRDWMSDTSTNSLVDVHRLHCPHSTIQLDKSTRNQFVTGSLPELKANFQNLMQYCATDVAATFEAFNVLWPQFKERMGHPVTLSGMLELTTTYLPTNGNWLKYIEKAEEAFQYQSESVMRKLLVDLAQRSVCLTRNAAYQEDAWLWAADWELRKVWTKEETAAFGQAGKPADVPEFARQLWSSELSSGVGENGQEINLPETTNKMFGYPTWYRELCDKTPVATAPATSDPNSAAGSSDRSSSLGILPTKLTSQTRITSRLLQLTWYHYPLHHERQHGWGFLIPDPDYIQKWDANPQEQSKYPQLFPGVFEVKIPGKKKPPSASKKTKSSKSSAKHTGNEQNENGEETLANGAESDADAGLRPAAFPFLKILEHVQKSTAHSGPVILDTFTIDTNTVKSFFDNGFGLDPESRHKAGENVKKRKASSAKDKAPNIDGYCPDVKLPGCLFIKLPHPAGYKSNVGNPLSRSFIAHLEAGRLQSSDPDVAKKIVQVNNFTSFWRGYRDRIMDQMPIWLDEHYLPGSVISDPGWATQPAKPIGAILPLLAPSGTITRRSVERIWMTAINPTEDKIGSEQKAMIQAPPGYRFVGADVDSQELWIATMLGDRICKIYGGTPASWQLLRGDKASGTDQHSMVARQLGISRDDAKVLNYGRLYGAGLPFFIQLLKQFNRQLSDHEVKQLAQKLFTMTKGKRANFMFFRSEDAAKYSKDGSNNLTKSRNEIKSDLLMNDRSYFGFDSWHNGTESDMFNGIEQIARSVQPATPVLGARITKSLDNATVRANSKFLTTKCNWVVQSSAVDYLHIMLCCMRWLMEECGIQGRFMISIHDEVRYLVESGDQHRAALALQLTNLLTRAYFAHQLGFEDLPESVAFFSSVDLDEVLRKEVDLDCATPSNSSGLYANYGIRKGSSMTISDILDKTGGKLQKD